MASKPEHAVEGALKCPMCLSELTDPRMLPCLHTLCEHCISSLLSSCGPIIRCPACRHECQTPGEGVSGFPKNFFLSGVKDLLQELKELRTSGGQRSGRRQCENSKQNDKEHGMSTAYCADCAEFYCESCSSSHIKGGAGRHHTLKPAGNVDPSTALAFKARKRNLKCSEHPDERVDSYCDTCHVAICTTCCWLNHKQHQRKELKVAGEECQMKLEELLQATDTRVQRILENLTELEGSSQKIKRDTNKARQGVKQAANEMRDLVTKREQHLLHQIEDTEKGYLAEVRLAQEATEARRASAESLTFYIWALLDSGDVTDQVILTPGVEEELHQQQAAPLRRVKWTAGFKREVVNQDALNTMLGTVTRLPQLLSPPTVITSLEDLTGAVGLVVIDQYVCVIGELEFERSEASWLYIHNTEINTFQTYKLEHVEPSGMVGIRKKNITLIIPDYKKKLRHVTLNPHDMEIRDHAVAAISFEPRDISTHPVTDQLVIADATNNAIAICDIHGNVQKSVNVAAAVGDIRCAVVADDGYVVLDCNDSGRVHWIDGQGRVTHTYGCREDESLRFAWQVLKTSQDHLVVTDNGNQRLHLISAGGRLLCHMLNEDRDISWPVRACMNEATSLLYVAESALDCTKVLVYKLSRDHGDTVEVTFGTFK